MHLPRSLLSLLLLLLPQAQSAPTGSTLQTALDDLSQEQGFTIPTRYESTVLGRRLLALSSTGTLATVFPSNTSSYPRLPSGLENIPIGLPDYIASCEEPSGNPTLLALTISTSTRNAVSGSNVSLSLSWWDVSVPLVPSYGPELCESDRIVP